MEENNPKNIEEEIDFENVAKSPIRWFGTIYPYFIILIIIAGLYYVTNLNTINENKIKPTIADSTKFKKELATKTAVMIAGVDVALISKSTPELTAKGKELYSASCASCHGAEGKGDGIAGAGMNPPPRNFTSKEEWTNGKSIADMFKTLEEGIAGTGMVAYEYLPVADRFAMIHFIHSLMSEFPENTPDELAALDATYSLSKGRVMPNQIPVAKALKLIAAENSETINRAIALASIINVNKSALPQNVYSAFGDLKKLSYFLMKSDVWMNSNADFRNYISPTINVNGFKPSALSLSEEQTGILRSFLIELYKK